MAWRKPCQSRLDHFNHNHVMFAEKPKQLKDEKCDGCGLDPHTGDCVKEANQQRRREEMGQRLQILHGNWRRLIRKKESDCYGNSEKNRVVRPS